MIPPGKARTRFKDYVARAETGVASKGVPDVVTVCDWSQDPKKQPRDGRWLPAVTQSAEYYIPSRDKFLTMNEVDVSQGWPSKLFPQTLDKYGHCCLLGEKHWPEDGTLQRRMQQKMLGNGQDLVMLGAWVLYIACHTIDRREHTKFDKWMSWKEDLQHHEDAAVDDEFGC